MRKKGIHKSFHVYLISKLKKVTAVHLPTSSKPSNAATSWLLSSCKHPRTPSFAVVRDQPKDVGGGGGGGGGAPHDPAATLSDVDRFLCENFRSMYYRDEDDDINREFSSESPSHDTDPPAGTIRSSERFFVSPGTSNSLLDEAGRPSAATTSSSSSSSSPAVPSDGVAVTTFSKDPYDDFRRSMQDMVDARHVDPHQAFDWDFMEELLFCYLELNDRSVHKYILRAFTDLTVSYRSRITSSRPGRRRRKAKEGEMVVPRHFPMAG